MNEEILVTRSSMPSFEEYCEEIKKLWDSHWLTNMGVEYKELQRQLEVFWGLSACDTVYQWKSFAWRLS